MEEKDDKVVPSTTEKKDEQKTDVKTDSSPADKGVNEGDSPEPEVPWHKDPRFKNDLKLLKVAKNLVEINNLEDIDDLKDLVESGRKVYGKKIDLDNLDKIVEKAETLDRYQKHWAQQEELNKRNAETPEETIVRLQRKVEEVSGEKEKRDLVENEAREAKKAVTFYDSEVQELINGIENLSAPEKDYLTWSIGVDNDCNKIDITDKKQVKRVVTDGVKKYNNLVRTVKDEAIKEYLAGKTSIPKVPSTDGTVATTKVEPPKGLGNMRKSFHELMKQGGS